MISAERWHTALILIHCPVIVQRNPGYRRDFACRYVPATDSLSCRCSYEFGSTSVDRPNPGDLQLQVQPKGLVELEHQGRGHRGHDRAEAFDADRAHLLGLSLGIDP